MSPFESLYNQAIFLYSSLTWFGLIDLLLVTTAFYFMLTLVRRSPAGYFMREILLVGLGLFVLTALLPLPVFDWLVRGVLVAILVAMPIIFQAQLRRFFERVSRTSGLAAAVRESATEYLIPEITHAVENMASTRTGALIVLEGNDLLEEVVKTGVSIGGEVTSELLGSLFYSGTPLHDGAVIIRGDDVIAAGCVLPLTQQFLSAEKRLGTRHRAAVGLSEVTDALIIVVSEETGQISIATGGELHRPLTLLDLREHLLDFYGSTVTASKTPSIGQLFNRIIKQIWLAIAPANFQQIFTNLGLLIVAALLTMVVWSFVLEQTNPFQLTRVEGITLRIENVPPNTQMIPPPPEQVTAVVQTTEDLLPTLSASGFQAEVQLENTAPGLYRLPVEVNSSSGQVLVIRVDPPSLDFELAPVISRTLPIQVVIPDQANIPAAYELVGVPTVVPNQVEIVGPEPIVERIEEVETSISLANATTPIRESRPLRLLDEQGREIDGVQVQPSQVRVSANIRPRLNARVSSVQPRIIGTPPLGYQISTLRVTPDNITLQGSVDQLRELDNIIETLPVDVSEATGDMIVQVPLNLPSNIQALDSSGVPIRTVTVSIGIAPRAGNLTLSRSIQLLGANQELISAVEPRRVELLLTGTQPLLNEIQQNPDLVQVVIDATNLQSGRMMNVTPDVVAPDGIEAQIVPAFVRVTVDSPTVGEE
ncbi:MAG TPA: diadenylate cyclase CdaA [Anaerolineae bacterium]|nr:diadenylate cyclase CdaA [Anaerolineae bacterium]HMR63128.1 diadenylate cyclase CdaA [Anaerolineae bacterium]